MNGNYEEYIIDRGNLFVNLACTSLELSGEGDGS